MFEHEQFAGGTRAIAQAIASSRAFSLAGGGETVAALAKFGVTDKIGYVSTAGGAFLEFLEGKKLPAVEILEQRAAAKANLNRRGAEDAEDTRITDVMTSRPALHVPRAGCSILDVLCASAPLQVRI